MKRVGAERPSLLLHACASQLNREERIAAAGASNLPKRRPWQGRAEATSYEVVDRLVVERSNADGRPGGGEGHRGTGRVAVRLGEPSGGQDADRRFTEPTKREQERRCRRRVEPLGVVDRDDYRLAGNEAKRISQRECNCSLIRGSST